MAVPNNSGGKRPASRDVARLVRVSHTTVSFVVNNVATANIIPGDAGARACRTSRNSTTIPFTSLRYLASLQASDGRISMDGKGRALDNMFTERLWRTIKYEEVYIHEYVMAKEARHGLTCYLSFLSITTSAHTSLSATGRHKRHATIQRIHIDDGFALTCLTPRKETSPPFISTSLTS